MADCIHHFSEGCSRHVGQLAQPTVLRQHPLHAKQVGDHHSKCQPPTVRGVNGQVGKVYWLCTCGQAPSPAAPQVASTEGPLN